MDEDSCDKTGFICDPWLYQFKVMLYWPKNAPATFQQVMELILGDLRGKICFVYMDDIIYSTTLSNSFHILYKLQEAHLTVT